MKGKESLGDPKGWEAKSGLASSGRGLTTFGETVFLLMSYISPLVFEESSSNGEEILTI